MLLKHSSTLLKTMDPMSNLVLTQADNFTQSTPRIIKDDAYPALIKIVHVNYADLD